MTSTRHITFYSNGFNLAATLVLPEDNYPVAGVIRIGGGANLPHWPNRWQDWLGSNNIASMAFDFIGVGNSEGKLGETNLFTRLEDARTVLETFRESTGISMDRIHIMGVSMGAPIALALATVAGSAGLILVSPAAYSPSAWDKHFGSAFTEAIREPESWKDSEEFEAFRSFSGRILLVYGEQDSVIPAGILTTYSRIVEEKGQYAITLDASHSFAREQSEEVEAKGTLWSSIVRFVKDNHSDAEM